MARSNPVPSLGSSAGARLTVSLRVGKPNPEFCTAAFTRTFASWMARSVRPTTVNPGRPLLWSASTVTGTPAMPWIAQQVALAVILFSVSHRPVVTRPQVTSIRITDLRDAPPPGPPYAGLDR